MKWCLALDASFSRVDRPTFRALKALDFYGLGGPKVFIQDVWTGLSVPAPAYANQADALDEGYRISPYTVVNMRPGLFAAQKAREVCAGLWPAIAKVAIDVEVPTTEPIIYDACLETELRGKEPYIYSGFGAWRTALGSNVISPRLHRWRIWNAYYDSDPDIDFWRYPWGGWTLDGLVGEQFKGTTALLGKDFDLSIVDAEFFGVEGDDMTLTADQERQLREAAEGIAAVSQNLGALSSQLDVLKKRTEGILQLAISTGGRHYWVRVKETGAVYLVEYQGGRWTSKFVAHADPGLPHFSPQFAAAIAGVPWPRIEIPQATLDVMTKGPDRPELPAV